jgi:DNA-binding PadR family transcriptional regulator
VKSEWGDSENNRKAKFYRLTPAGRRQLGTATTTWERIAAAVEFSAKAVREAKS